MRVLTDSDLVREHRKATLQFITLNHPVDCGICDKAGECTLQDYHYAYNGAPSISREPKVHATKFHDLSERIVLDNERCILCSRCVRFTREISKSHALGIKHRGDESLVRAAEDGALDDDPYSDNVIDICPVGALLSQPFLLQGARLVPEADAVGVPGLRARLHASTSGTASRSGSCSALDPKQNASIARVTPLENPAVNGPWICNKGRDLAQIFERPRAEQRDAEGQAGRAGRGDRRGAALIGGGEAAGGAGVVLGLERGTGGVRDALAGRFTTLRQGGPRCRSPASALEDDLLIRADKNPNTRRRARAVRRRRACASRRSRRTPTSCWSGARASTSRSCRRARRSSSSTRYLQPENGHADVFIPVSIQTERAGHYTNFDGVVSALRALLRRRRRRSPMPRTLFAALARERGRGRHDPGPRHLRRSTSATRSAC